MAKRKKEYDHNSTSKMQFIRMIDSCTSLFQGPTPLGRGGLCYYWYTLEDCLHQRKLRANIGRPTIEFDEAIKRICRAKKPTNAH
jgi:hypothetical protein